MRSHEPVEHVQVVQVLLDDLVAADPHEGIPGAVLPFHIAPLRVAGLLLDHRASFPVGIRGRDIADGAVADLLPGLHVLLLRAPLRAGFDRQLQFLGFLRGCHELADINRIGAERLLREHVLLGFNRGLEVHRAVARRRGQEDDIDAGGQHLLVGVKAHKPVLGVNLDPVAVLRGPCASAERPRACPRTGPPWRPVRRCRCLPWCFRRPGCPGRRSPIKPELQLLFPGAPNQLRPDDRKRGCARSRSCQKGPSGNVLKILLHGFASEGPLYPKVGQTLWGRRSFFVVCQCGQKSVRRARSRTRDESRLWRAVEVQVGRTLRGAMPPGERVLDHAADRAPVLGEQL